MYKDGGRTCTQRRKMKSWRIEHWSSFGHQGSRKHIYLRHTAVLFLLPWSIIVVWPNTMATSRLFSLSNVVGSYFNVLRTCIRRTLFGNVVRDDATDATAKTLERTLIVDVWWNTRRERRKKVHRDATSRAAVEQRCQIQGFARHWTAGQYAYSSRSKVY